MQIPTLYDAASHLFSVLMDPANEDKTIRLRESWPEIDVALRDVALALHTEAVDRDEGRRPPV